MRIKPVLLHIEKAFWFWCIACTLIGLFLPAPFRYLQNSAVLKSFLMGILFFTCLKIDLSLIIIELKRIRLIAGLSLLILIIMPILTYPLALYISPAYAIGFLILAAMPAGMAAGALTDVAGGRVSLALALTMITSILCPFTIPPIIKLLAGTDSSIVTLLKQSGMLMLLIFVPLVCSQLVRHRFKAKIENIKWALTPLSIISLCLLILGAMSANALIFQENLGKVLYLLIGVFIFSSFYHILGFAAPLRKDRDERIAASVSMAYVNNGLAIVFAMTFFKETPLAVLPAILIEFPMILLIVPLRRFNGYLQAKAV